MYRLLTRSEVERMLAPWGCAFDQVIAPGCEAWTTRSGFTFCLTPEDTGHYDEFMVLAAINMSIKPAEGEA